MRKLAPCGWQVSGHDRVCRCRRRAYLAAGRVVSADPGPAESLADQRVFWLYGPLFGLIMMLGLGGFVRVARRDGWRISIQRRRDGPSMMPWVAAVVLLVTRSRSPTLTTGICSPSSRSPAWRQGSRSPRRRYPVTLRGGARFKLTPAQPGELKAAIVVAAGM
jgi:hypothetical protein